MMAVTQNFTIYIAKNASNNFTNCGLFPEPRSSFLFRVIVFFFIVLMSLVGNGLVCHAATRSRKRPFSYYLVTNLAVAELFYTAMQPFHFVYDTKPYSWIFGSFMCHVVDPMSTCANLVITFTLATIAVHRCISMVQPLRYHGPTTRAAYMLMAVSWIWGIVLSLPDSVTRVTYKYKDCDLFLCQNSVDLSSYKMAIFFFNVVIPFIIMVLAYSIVIFKVKKHLLKTKKESIQSQSNEINGTRTSVISNEVNRQPPITENEQNKLFQNKSEQQQQQQQQKELPRNKMMRQESDVLNMIYLIILVFFFCHLPSYIVFILDLHLEALGLWHYYWLVMLYLNLLYTVPSALHPICYGATSRLLRHSCIFSFFLRRKRKL